MTAPEIIREVLKQTPGIWYAVHEITANARNRGHWISDNSAASRLCIDLKGEVEGRTREGKRFKEWRLTPAGQAKAPPAKAAAAPLFFYSNRSSAIPSPYFTSIEALRADKGFSMDCMIWTGSHEAPQPYPYEGEE